ncbi:YesN/AraC family two-component response regulator [Anaerotaenia torta]|uniref:AraC family transcriptional regulator n=1 Tax=Anaerotaenia torta TaxID=433293 RepID=UPI003D239A9B
MNMDEFREFIHKYTEIELYNKTKYQQSNYNKGYNYAWETPRHNAVLSEPTDDQTRQFFIVTGLTDVFPEKQYFKENHDITLIKHDRYAYSFNHKHNFFEIVYCASGEFIHEINSTKRTHREGELYVIAPGVNHALHVYNDSIVLNLLIKNSSFDHVFRSIIGKQNILSHFYTNSIYSKENNGILIFDTKNDAEIKEMFIKLFYEEYESQRYTADILNHMTMLIFYYLMRNYEDTAVNLSIQMENDDKINAIMQYIRDNFMTVTLDDLAREFYFNKYYISRLIKEKTGDNISNVIKKMRLDITEQLVANTNLCFWEIGQAVGYTDTTHLFRIFKQRYGVSPKEYRKRFQKNGNEDNMSKNTNDEI